MTLGPEHDCYWQNGRTRVFEFAIVLVMGNPFQKADPWETSFETMTTKAQQAGTQVKKSAAGMAKAAAGDVKAALTGDFQNGSLETMAGQAGQNSQTQTAGNPNIPAMAELEKQKRELLAQTRQNLERINMEIKRARDERLKKEEERKKTEEKKKEQKKAVEQKKKEEDPAWKKMLRKGSHEIAKGISG